MLVVNTPPAAVGGGATEDDWVRVDVTDGTWTKNDPDTTASNISNTAGINSVDIDGTSNANIVDGCVWYKELKTPTGAAFDFSDKPVDARFYLHWPGTGWQDNSSPAQSGGGNNPPQGSRSYCVVGITTDPENLPTSGASPVPRDILGCGLEWTTPLTRTRRTIIRNTSNAGTYGSINKNCSNLKTITAADVTAGHKACNRLEWSTYITKAEQLGSGNLDVAGSPRSGYLVWIPRYDNGDKYLVGNFSAAQRWGRTRTTKLYAFVAVGRGSSGGSGITMEFDAYYNVRLLDGGNSPSGKTGLSGP